MREGILYNCAFDDFCWTVPSNKGIPDSHGKDHHVFVKFKWDKLDVTSLLLEEGLVINLEGGFFVLLRF